jgi:hypothetical protein
MKFVNKNYNRNFKLTFFLSFTCLITFLAITYKLFDATKLDFVNFFFVLDSRIEIKKDILNLLIL